MKQRNYSCVRVIYFTRSPKIMLILVLLLRWCSQRVSCTNTNNQARDLSQSSALYSPTHDTAANQYKKVSQAREIHHRVLWGSDTIKIASIAKKSASYFSIKWEAHLDALKSWAAFELESPKYSAKYWLTVDWTLLSTTYMNAEEWTQEQGLRIYFVKIQELEKVLCKGNWN